MNTQIPNPFEVVLPAAYLGSTHASVVIQDGTVLNKPAGYVFELFHEEVLKEGGKPYRFTQPTRYVACASPSEASAATDIYAALVNPPAPTPNWSAIRAERDRRLATCDWTQLSDAPLSSQARADWAEYRQALRDVPQQNTNDIVWPVEP